MANPDTSNSDSRPRRIRRRYRREQTMHDNRGIAEPPHYSPRSKSREPIRPSGDTSLLQRTKNMAAALLDRLRGVDRKSLDISSCPSKPPFDGNSELTITSINKNYTRITQGTTVDITIEYTNLSIKNYETDQDIGTVTISPNESHNGNSNN